MRMWGIVLAVGVAASLVGCSDDPEPRTLPPLTSATPSPSVVAMPSEAAAETPEGAAAFARYYFDVVNRGFSEGNADSVRALSHPECDGCNNLIGAMEETPRPGERIEGGVFSVLSAEAPPLEGENALVDLRYAISEIRVLDATGKVLRTTPPEPEVGGQLRLLRAAQSWVVRGFRNVTL